MINKDLFNLSLRLRDEGKTEEAIKGLTHIINTTEDHFLAPVYGVLGGIYFENDKLEIALHNYKKAVSLTPSSELASLGVFHSSWDLGKISEAINEMERFLLLKPHCTDYLEIINELFEEWNDKTKKTEVERIKKLKDRFGR